MLLAVDFDGTIVENRYPEIGSPIPGAISTLLKLQKEGHRLILWTCREGQRLEEAVSFCRSKGIYFESCNENKFERIGRKVYADYYIDDRNVCGFPGWDKVYSFIRKKQLELEAVMDMVNVQFEKESTEGVSDE